MRASYRRILRSLLLVLWLARSIVSQRTSIQRIRGHSQGASLLKDEEKQHSRRKRERISSGHAPPRIKTQKGRIVCRRKSDCQPVSPPPPASAPSGPAPPRVFKRLPLSWYLAQADPPSSVTPLEPPVPSPTRSPDALAPTPNPTRNPTPSLILDPSDSPTLPQTLSPAVVSSFAPFSLFPQPSTLPAASPVTVAPSLEVVSPRPTLVESPIGALTPVEMEDSSVAPSSETSFPSVDASPTGALTPSETSFPSDISSPVESLTGDFGGSLEESSVTPSPETSFPTDISSPVESPTGDLGGSLEESSVTPSTETSFPTDLLSPVESPTGESGGSPEESSVTPSSETSFPPDILSPVESLTGDLVGSLEESSVTPSWETSFPTDLSSPVESPRYESGSPEESSVTPSSETSFPTDISSFVESLTGELGGSLEESSVTPSWETSFPTDISSPAESPIGESKVLEESSVTPSSETSFPTDISSFVESPTGELGGSRGESSVTPSWEISFPTLGSLSPVEKGGPTFSPSSKTDVPVASPADTESPLLLVQPVASFDVTLSPVEDGDSFTEPTEASGSTVSSPTAESVPCNKVNIDFNRLANGTQLQGGRYISTEYLRDYGVKLVASGSFTNLPRLFNTSEVGNIANLGSPNQECSPSGPGEGESGAPGEPGENCEPQGNILIIQNKNDDDELPYPNDVGGVINIELSSRVIFTFGIRLMNIAGNGTTVKIAYVNAAGTKIPKTIAVEGLGENSIETVPIFKTGVFNIAVNLSGPGAITEIGLCVSPGEEERL